MITRRLFARFLLVVVALLYVGAATAQNILWRVKGDSATIYLLGSVHLLRHADFPLDPALDAAYQAADRLVLELDINSANPMATQALINRIGRIDEGDLADWLGPRDFARAQTLAAELDMDLDRMRPLKPWLAAITVLQVQLARLGFSPDLGVDIHFAERARADGKPVEGLETIEFQLAQFDGLSREEQSAFLMQSLEEAENIPEEIDAMMEAWRRGNAGGLASILEEGFKDYPALYDRLVKDRNANWLPRLLELLDGEDDVLIVVGALHLVGSGSVIDMLQRRGFEAEQL